MSHSPHEEVRDELAEAFVNSVTFGTFDDVAMYIDDYVNKGALNINAPSHFLELTALNMACLKEKIEIVSYLLHQKDIDVETRSSLHMTPFLFAVSRNNLEMCQLLVEHKANVHACSEGGTTALIWAAKQFERAGMDDFLTVAKTFAKMGGFGAKGSPFVVEKNPATGVTSVLAAGKDFRVPKVAAYLLHQGVKVDDVDDGGRTALHWATRIEFVKLLVEFVRSAGPKKHSKQQVSDLLNKKTPHGLTALYLATVRGKGDIVEYLLKEGADHTCYDSNGNTPLYAAKRYGFQSIVTILEEAGATELNNRGGADAISAVVSSAELQKEDAYEKEQENEVEKERDDDGDDGDNSASVPPSGEQTQAGPLPFTVTHAAAAAVPADVAALGGGGMKKGNKGGKKKNVKVDAAPTMEDAAAGGGGVSKATTGVVNALDAEDTGDKVSDEMLEIEDQMLADELITAARNGDLAAIKKSKITINVTYDCGIYGGNRFGYSLLHAAAEFGHLDIIKYMVELHRADITDSFTRSYYAGPIYSTPLCLARRGGHGEVVEYIEEVYRKRNRPIPKEQSSCSLQ